MKYKTREVDGITVRYSSDWIHDIESEEHFLWYYHQAKVVYDHCTRDENLLEIGLGAGLLSDLLKRRNWDIKTLDIDADKKPDICESASEFDYSSINVNVVLAFEVFEHIPFDTFKKVIERISESKVHGIYFSLPWSEYRLIDFKLSIPKFHNISFWIPIHSKKINTITHFWELATKPRMLNEKRLIRLDEVDAVFNQYGFMLTPIKKVGCIQFFKAVR